MAEPHFSPNSVYKYFDRHGILIYVGITGAGSARNKQHNSDKAWWICVEKQDVEHFDTRAAAHQREVELIETHRPPFNKQHNPEHDELRAAYIALAQSGRLGMSARELIQAGGKRSLQLTPRVSGSGYLSFLTQLQDGGIAAVLKHVGGVRVFCPGHPRGLGAVQNIKRHPLSAHIITTIALPPEARIRSAVARLRYPAIKPEVIAEIKRIDLALE